MSAGFIAVDRGIFDDQRFAPEPFTQREAWLWLIAQAAWKPCQVRVGRHRIDLRRGQCAYSLRFMANRWQWSEPSVRRFLGRLKTDATIDADSDAGVTVITICNYDKSQRVSLASDATVTQQRRRSDAVTDAVTDAPSDAPSDAVASATTLCNHDGFQLAPQSSDAPSDAVTDAPRDAAALQKSTQIRIKETKERKKDSVGVCTPTRSLSAIEDDFVKRFWKPYPRTPNMSRKQALAEWQKLKPDEREAAVLAVPKFIAWIKTQRDYQTLHAVRFLSYRRFEGFNEPPDPEAALAPPAGEPLFKHGDVAPTGHGRAGFVYLKSETPEWEAWQTYNKSHGLKSAPTDKSGGWFFQAAAPPGHEPRADSEPHANGVRP